MESTEEIGVVGPDGASMGVVDRAAVATLLGDEGR
jgi:hypothetical protein